MKRNLWKTIFVALGFFILFGTLSCNNIISPKESAQVSFSLYTSFLQSTKQTNPSIKNIRALETDGYQIAISLYQITGSVSETEIQELDTSKLTLLESITPPPVYSDGKVYATFNNVTIGIDAVIFVEIYETAPADASPNLVYKGNSSVFTVQKGENTVGVDLKKVQNQEVTQKFTVTFDANGGSFESGSQTQQVEVQANTPVTEPEEKPSSGDKTFEFWTTQQDDGNFSQYDFSQPVTADLTLYAQWRAFDQVASVKFDPATSTVDYNTEITLSCDTSAATIYYTTDGSDPTTSSNVYQTTPITITQKTTIKAYAVKSGMTDSTITEITYSLNQYTVQFVLNGGSFTESGKNNPVSVQSGTEVALKDYQAERTGHTFGGWYFDEECNNPVDDSGIVTPIQANITLYAKWEVVSIAVNKTVTSFSALQSAITGATGTSQDTPYVIGIDSNFDTEGSISITVTSHVKLVATGDYTITKTTDFAGINIFTVNSGASLTLGDANAGGTLTIDGGGTAISTTTKSLINVTGTLVLNEKSVLQNNVCYDNYDSSNGAAVYSSGGNIIINGGTIKDNQLLREGKSGGGIYLENGIFTMTSGSFINNNASTTNGNKIYGGALYVDNSAVSIRNANFDGNSVSATNTECYGGAICIMNSGTESTPATISDCSFTNNSAYQRGGAIYVTGSEANGSVTIQNCTFNDNSATSPTARGGAICFANTSGTIHVIGGTFGTNTVNSVEEDIAHYGSSTATLVIGGSISVSDINLTTNSLKIQNSLTNTSSEKIKITLNSYSRTDQVLTAADGVNLSEEVGKFTLADSGYKINSDGTISTQ